MKSSTYITAVVDKSGQVAALGGIDNIVLINSEKIRRSNALFFIALLADIRDHRSHYLTDVFDHHLVGPDAFKSKQAPVVNGRFAKGHIFSPELQK